MTLAAVVGDPSTGVRDALLRVAADPERRARLYELLGPFCHECRNQLNTLKLSLYLARRCGASVAGELWNVQDARYREMERVFDRLQQLCRPMAVTPVRLPIALMWDEVLPGWAEQCERHGFALEVVRPATPIVGDFDPNRLRPALDAFVEWRLTTGPSMRTFTFSWRAKDSAFEVEWSETAPAPPVSDVRADAAPESLALPLLARVLAAHGGTLEVESRPRYRVRLRWPLEMCVHE